MVDRAARTPVWWFQLPGESSCCPRVEALSWESAFLEQVLKPSSSELSVLEPYRILTAAAPTPFYHTPAQPGLLFLSGISVGHSAVLNELHCQAV